jgi:hypothetical protein
VGETLLDRQKPPEVQLCLVEGVAQKNEAGHAVCAEDPKGQNFPDSHSMLIDGSWQ